MRVVRFSLHVVRPVGLQRVNGSGDAPFVPAKLLGVNVLELEPGEPAFGYGRPS